ncbi:glutamine amidotransferase [Auraticoccus sp. F435]|uniref:Lipid II isoglutaminyl synthase (glutamine-hydrolyzing) subunit GatD n=1 Tax=Auraticoccus cholistanensis TaxID=2656650 RepID=A0A6A9V297_9ACTN|nr:glutamine amidotransferase [Auraticoccus cholistanensis]MVA77713.1 glutamine amidotransferase [Auraticoccus cholistanensis]
MPSTPEKVHVALVYQSLLGIYGDRGNATVVTKRLQWRGFEPVLTVVEPGDPLPQDAHIYLIGGGEDAAQISAARLLRADGALQRAAERGAAVFGVCAGYQILGRSFTVGEHDQVTEGLGLLDVTTTRGPQRAVGELLGTWSGADGEARHITGFENHGGWTTRGPDAEPFCTVEVGIGNGDGTDGAVNGTVIGLYPHGPLLARNPALADHVISLGLGGRELPPLDHPEIAELRRQRLAAVRPGR